jgi:hypothetical protein
MTAQHWKLALLKSGKHIVLFATTTDQMVERDLGGETDRSLIQTARQYHRRGQTLDQDHRDLAIAALMAYADGPLYDLAFEHIEAALAVPEGVPTCYIAGSDRNPLVPVWERNDDEDFDDDDQ